MAERVRQAQAHPRTSLDNSMLAAVGRGLPAGLKHCWVMTPDGPVPGLLVGWRRDEELGWLGRVVRPVPDEDGWLILEDWIPAGGLLPAPGDPPEN